MFAAAQVPTRWHFFVVRCGEKLSNDREPHLGRVEAAQVAAELQELRPPLDRLDVAIELVLAQVQGREQVAHPAVAVVGRPPPAARFTVGVLMLATAFGPLPTRMRHQIEGPELVYAEEGFGLAVLWYDLLVGDGVEVLDACLLGRVVGVAGGLPGLQALKGDAFLAEQDAQALVADVVDHPLGNQEVRQLGQTPGRERQVVLSRLGLGVGVQVIVHHLVRMRVHQS
ncbi:hypothetical protein OG452_34620 [Streptomyces sp. NBC_01197]|nr:hypothetical protein OG452_00245 [Streptomyces sp. NBC_01197]WSR73079.1 hypothetical protein OG452_34620 [Streptomyces sp. NBC_01197]